MAAPRNANNQQGQQLPPSPPPPPSTLQLLLRLQQQPPGLVQGRLTNGRVLTSNQVTAGEYPVLSLGNFATVQSQIEIVPYLEVEAYLDRIALLEDIGQDWNDLIPTSDQSIRPLMVAIGQHSLIFLTRLAWLAWKDRWDWFADAVTVTSTTWDPLVGLETPIQYAARCSMPSFHILCKALRLHDRTLKGCSPYPLNIAALRAPSHAHHLVATADGHGADSVSHTVQWVHEAVPLLVPAAAGGEPVLLRYLLGRTYHSTNPRQFLLAWTLAMEQLLADGDNRERNAVVQLLVRFCQCGVWRAAFEEMTCIQGFTQLQTLVTRGARLLPQDVGDVMRVQFFPLRDERAPELDEVSLHNYANLIIQGIIPANGNGNGNDNSIDGSVELETLREPTRDGPDGVLGLALSMSTGIPAVEATKGLVDRLQRYRRELRIYFAAPPGNSFQDHLRQLAARTYIIQAQAQAADQLSNYFGLWSFFHKMRQFLRSGRAVDAVTRIPYLVCVLAATYYGDNDYCYNPRCHSDHYRNGQNCQLRHRCLFCAKEPHCCFFRDPLSGDIHSGNSCAGLKLLKDLLADWTADYLGPGIHHVDLEDAFFAILRFR